MKEPDRTNIVIMLLMIFCMGMLVPVVGEILGGGNFSSPPNVVVKYLIIGLMVFYIIMIPLFCFDFLKNHKFTIEPKRKASKT